MDKDKKLKLRMNSFDDLEEARKPILQFCNTYCPSDEVVDILEMAILEACHNAIRHGSKVKNKSLCNLKLIFDNQSIKVIVKNYGKAYEVLAKEAFSVDQNFLQYKEGGLGIPLIKSLVDTVDYERKPNNINELIIIKKFENKQ